MGEQRRKYPRENKLEAVRRVVEGSEPVSKIARALGILGEMLHSWVRQFKAEAVEAFRGSGKLTSQDEELRRLRRDLARAFFVQMCIAWNNLLQAIFERDDVSYFYREADGRRFKRVDGEKKSWDLRQVSAFADLRPHAPRPANKGGSCTWSGRTAPST